jgi:hypothetical protein
MPPTLTPEQINAIQSYICEQSLLWQQLQRTMPAIALASMHISPDSAWVSVEHEHEDIIEQDSCDQSAYVSGQRVIRLSPACHTVVTKI